MATLERTSNTPLILLLAVLLVGGATFWLWPATAPEPGESDEATSHANAASLAEVVDAGERVDAGELGRAAKAGVSGKVRSRGGGPLLGAQVCAWPLAAELRGLGESTPKCARTNHEGHYRIEGLWPVRTQVGASAAEHRPEVWRVAEARGRWRGYVPLAPGRDAEAIDFELEGGGVMISGVVADLGGGEIEGALIKTEAGYGYGKRGGAIAFSDAQGRFELWAEPGTTTLTALAEGYARGQTESHAPTARAEIFLTPESVLIGRVVDASTDEPLADVPVSAGGGVAEARTDAEGNFRLDGLAPGVYKPTVRDDELYGMAEVQVHLGLAQTSEPVVLRAHRAASLRGTIVIASSGGTTTKARCEAGSVSLTRSDRDRYARASGTVDDSGEVIVRGVLPCTYEVDVSCTGYASRREYPKLEITGESLVDLVWEVDEGQAIRGVVVDPSGTGVADARVSARMLVEAEDARAQLTSAYVESCQADGRFELAGLLPGRYELSVMSEAPAPELPTVVELPVGADLNDVRIELVASGIIAGRVVDEGCVPQSGVVVSASALGKWPSNSAMTDDAGNFVIEHVRLGEARVSVDEVAWGASMRAPGTTDDDLQGELVEVVAGERVEVELVVEARVGQIRGRVLDEHGSPVDDAFIHAERMSDSATANAGTSRMMVRWGDWRNTPILSEVDGSFTISALGPGRYIVRAHRRGGGEAIVEDVALDSSVELTIAATGLLGGTIVVPGGEAPERFTITVDELAQGISLRDQFFRTGGKWQLAELTAGKYRVSVSSTSGNAELEVELAAGERREDLELSLQPTVTLRGRVIDLDTGAPVPGMVVSVGGRAGGLSFGRTRGGELKEVSDAQGRFEVEGAATGKVEIMVMPRAWSSTADYGWNSFPTTIASDPAIQELGDLEVIARRTAPDQAAGELGFELKQVEPGTEPEAVRLTIGFIRPGGPASATELAVGDVIERVDGKSVLGVESRRYGLLSAVPAGTTLELELAGGKRVSITAGPAIE